MESPALEILDPFDTHSPRESALRRARGLACDPPFPSVFRGADGGETIAFNSRRPRFNGVQQRRFAVESAMTPVKRVRFTIRHSHLAASQVRISPARALACLSSLPSATWID